LKNVKKRNTNKNPIKANKSRKNAIGKWVHAMKRIVFIGLQKKWLAN
jgi:hypothetical protein